MNVCHYHNRSIILIHVLDARPSLHVHDNDPLMTNGKYNQHPVGQLQDEMIRESPPLPDRDDSPPPIHRPPFAGQDGCMCDVF